MDHWERRSRHQFCCRCRTQILAAAVGRALVLFQSVSTATPEFLFDKTRKNPGAGFPPPITGTIAPSDVLRLAGNEFLGFALRSGKMWRCNREESISLTLDEADGEIVGFAPVGRGATGHRKRF